MESTSSTSGPPAPEITPEHRWLQRMVGEWECSTEMLMPDGTRMTTTSRESVRSLGGLWTLGESRLDVSGSDQHADHLMTLGYDTIKGRFVGTFVASMMSFLWTYEGKLEGNTLTLECVGPVMSPDAKPGTLTDYKDIIEIIDDDTRTLRSVIRMPEGWVEFMKATYKRIKRVPA